MRAVNAQIVRVPDGRVGCLVHRMGLQGAVEFGQQRILETYALGTLVYHIALPPVERKGKRRTQMLWV